MVAVALIVIKDVPVRSIELVGFGRLRVYGARRVYRVHPLGAPETLLAWTTGKQQHYQRSEYDRRHCFYLLLILLLLLLATATMVRVMITTTITKKK